MCFYECGVVSLSNLAGICDGDTVCDRVCRRLVVVVGDGNLVRLFPVIGVVWITDSQDVLEAEDANILLLSLFACSWKVR